MAIKGDAVTLVCQNTSTSNMQDVQWFVPPGITEYANGSTTKAGYPRFSITGDHVVGVYNFRLVDARMSDAGVYWCIVGGARQKNHTLVVIGEFIQILITRLVSEVNKIL
jgi:hypothetical protein